MRITLTTLVAIAAGCALAAPEDARFFGGYFDGYDRCVSADSAIPRCDQAIAFPAIPGQLITNTVYLSATASSGLTVSNFTVIAGPGVIAALTNLTFTNSGTVSVRANQSGDADYNAAPPVTNTFNVAKLTPQLTLNDLAQIYNGSARAVTASTLPEGLAVSLTYDGKGWAPTNAGAYAVTGTVMDAVYYAAITGTLMVGKADQTITSFPNPGDQPATGTVGLRAQSASGLPVTNFAVISGPGVISGLTNLAFTGAGAVSVAAWQPGDGNWNAAPPVTNTFNVSKTTASVTLNNLTQAYNGSARIVTASTVPAGLAVTITYDGGSTAPANVGSYAVAGTVSDAIYQGSARGTLQIILAAPTATAGTYSNRVMVYWDAIPSATGYEVWRGTSSDRQSAAQISTSAQTFFLDTSAVPDVLYYYWIQAVTISGKSGFSLPGPGYCGTIANLAAPAGVQADDGAYSERVRIAWQAVDAATSYEVWRHASNDIASATLIGTTSSAYYDDFSIPKGICHYYWVKARTAHRDGDVSAPDSGWTRLENTAGLSATDGDFPYHIRVEWSAGENAAWYEVWREEVPGTDSPGGNPVMLAVTNGLTLNDYEVKAGIYYRYKVKAFNELTSSIDFSHDTGHRYVGAGTNSLAAIGDYDGDRCTDPALFNPGAGTLSILASALEPQSYTLSAGNGQGVCGDYDGDAKADPVVYYPDSGEWQAMLSSTGYSPVFRAIFGGGGPVAADFDGDGLADLALYDEAGGMLSAMLSNDGSFNITASCSIGGQGWQFISADFDGDAKADPAVYSESEGGLVALFSGSAYARAGAAMGGPGLSLHAADYDGDAKADPVLYEEATGVWAAMLSAYAYGTVGTVFGGPGCAPSIGDYDGDAKTDPAVYQPATGLWLIMFSARNYAVAGDNFGGAGLQPVVK